MVDTIIETPLSHSQTRTTEWSPKTRSEIFFDAKAGVVSKKINHLQGFGYGLNNMPEAEDYRREVGWAIAILKEESFELGKFLPQCELRIENGPGGDECYMDTQYIKGQRLEEIHQPSPEVSLQLADFLAKCTKMAEVTKAGGRIILPDLLGGVEESYPEFRNFVVEEETSRLYFVDLYPLAELENEFWSFWGFWPFGARVIKEKYRKNLEKAGQKVGDSQVLDATRALIEAIK